MSYISTKDFALEVKKGNVTNHSGLNKFGRNEDVGTATDPEDVWDGGGVWVAPTQARTHTLTGGATDTDGGAGANTVHVYGLDANYDSLDEVVTMAGAGGATTTGLYVIIFRARVIVSGATGTNAAAIVITADTDATVTATIAAGKGQTLMAIWQVPRGNTFYCTQWYIDANKSGSAGTAACELLARPFGESWQVKHHLGLTTAGSSHIGHKFVP